MLKNMCSLMIISPIIFLSCSLCFAQEEEKGRGYYDLGVFAYEDKDYTDAERNLKMALEINPDNALYRHFMGKIYLKMERYDDAMTHLSFAWEKDPDISGLKYDVAQANYHTQNYLIAGDLFQEIAEENPENVLAHYYAGISLYKEEQYDRALNHFNIASDKSPIIKTNGYYYAGICYLKMGLYNEAIEKLEFVRDHAPTESLRENSIKWLEAINKQKKALRPYSLYAKVGIRYDSNVRLEPDDEDRFTDEDDFMTIGYFSGNYNLLRRDNYVAGLGYRHYQTRHKDLNTYDLTASIFNIHGRYANDPFGIILSYLPHFYWLDSDRYIRRHQFKTEMIYNVSEDIQARFSYSYYSNNYLQDNNRDGHSNDVSIEVYYTLGDRMGYLFGGMDFEDRSTFHPDHSYREWEVNGGISIRVPWEMILKLTGKYSDRDYDNTDSRYLVSRDDGKYNSSISVSRKLYYEWLSVVGELDYTKRDSNISGYDYTRRTATLSLTARF
jgi:tetratricopeptide (TPR) repeat protein